MAALHQGIVTVVEQTAGNFALNDAAKIHVPRIAGEIFNREQTDTFRRRQTQSPRQATQSQGCHS